MGFEKDKVLKLWSKKVLIGVILFQVIMQLVLCYGSVGFDIDEMTSLSVANSVKGPFVDYNLEETWDRWIDGDYIKSYFIPSESSRFNFSNTIENSIKDVHPPIYYMVYNLASSIFFERSLSRWIGVSLNIIFFIITQYIMYLLIKKSIPNNSEYYALLFAILYGFSLGTSATIQFIRMYMMIMMICTLSVYIHWRIFNENYQSSDFILLALVVMGGGVTQYYFLIFQFFLSCFLCLYFLRIRSFKTLGWYVLTMAIGIISQVLIFPEMLFDLFKGSRGSQAIKSITSIHGLIDKIGPWAEVINKNLFYGFMWWLLIGFILIKGYLLFSGKYQDSMTRKFTNIITLTIIMYLLLIIKIAPYTVPRYICLFFPTFYFVIVYQIYTCMNFAKGYYSKVLFLMAAVGIPLLIVKTYKTNEVPYVMKERANRRWYLESVWRTRLHRIYISRPKSRGYD